MPTEFLCLAVKVEQEAEFLSRLVSQLPNAFAVHADYKEPTPGSVTPILFEARNLKFEAARLALLAHKHEEILRSVFAVTLQLVDQLRLAGGCLQKNSLEAGVFIGHAVDSVADIQAKICEIFPGEAFPST